MLFETIIYSPANLTQFEITPPTYWVHFEMRIKLFGIIKHPVSEVQLVQYMCSLLWQYITNYANLILDSFKCKDPPPPPEQICILIYD